MPIEKKEEVEEEKTFWFKNAYLMSELKYDMTDETIFKCYNVTVKLKTKLV